MGYYILWLTKIAISNMNIFQELQTEALQAFAVLQEEEEEAEEEEEGNGSSVRLTQTAMTRVKRKIKLFFPKSK